MIREVFLFTHCDLSDIFAEVRHVFMHATFYEATDWNYFLYVMSVLWACIRCTLIVFAKPSNLE